MTTDKKLILLLAAFFSILLYWGWMTSEVDIKTLDHSIVQYQDLPPTVADIFRHSKKYSKLGLGENLMNADSINTFKLEVDKTGPWTNYFIIIKNDKTKYSVPKDKAFPFVIYKNELFIPDRYNVGNSVTSESASYEKYILD